MSKMLIAFLCGMVFLGIGIFALQRGRKRKAACTAQTTATITDIHREVRIEQDEDRRERESSVYYPEYEYMVEERKYIKRSGTGSSSTKYKIGQVVPVLYNPADPNQHVLKDDRSNDVIGIACLLLGVGLMIAGFFV